MCIVVYQKTFCCLVWRGGFPQLMGKFFVAAWNVLKSTWEFVRCFLFWWRLLTLTNFGVPLTSHRYRMWYFRGTISMLDQVGGGDHSTSKFLTWGETRMSLGGSGFTIDKERRKKGHCEQHDIVSKCWILVALNFFFSLDYLSVKLSPISSNMKLDRWELSLSG